MRLLDCTLRDGAHINKGDFGANVIKGVANGLLEANVDFIELGFLMDKVYAEGNTFFISIENARQYYDSRDENRISLLVRAGTFNVINVIESEFLGLIRIAFRQDEEKVALDAARELVSNGIRVFLNPIAITTYSTNEFYSLVEKLKSIELEGIAIVDTYGALDHTSLEMYLRVLVQLPTSFKIGLHFHENRFLGQSLIYSSLKALESRGFESVIDTSLLGMGRAPGNVHTELVVPSYFNHIDLGKILSIIENYILPIRSQHVWGFDIYYSITGILKIDRSFGEYARQDGLVKSYELYKELSESDAGQRYIK